MRERRDRWLLLFGLSITVTGACAAVWACVQLAGLSDGELFPFWYWPWAAAFGYAAFRFFRLPASREKCAGFAFCFLLAFTQLIGRQYDFTPSSGGLTVGPPLRWLFCALCAAGLSPAGAWPVTLLLHKIKAKTAFNPGSSSVSFVRGRTGRTFALYFAVLLLLWQPFHLAYFPGLAEYDSGYQFWQNWNHLYNASNPLLHTLILGFFYTCGEKLATVNIGLAVFCLLQQTLMASSLSFALTVLRKNGTPWWMTGLLAAFFGLFPVFGMMAISMTKDVPFYCLLLVQLVMIWNGCRDLKCAEKKGYWVRLTCVTALTCLFRANALGFLLLIPPLICLARGNREFRLRLVCFLLEGTALAWGINQGLIAVTKAEFTLMRESLNVPIIQLARVTNYHEDAARDLTENHAEMVEMPMPYIPFVVDLAKWHWTLDGGNLGEFLGLWAKWGTVYPGEYIDAALLLNRGYWYLGDQTYARVYGNSSEQHLGVIPSRVSNNIETIVDTCFIPALREHMEYMYSENAFLKAPVFRLLFCPAFYVWMLLFALTSTLCQKRRDTAFLIRAGALYLAGLLLGPCCILRYALQFFMLSPLLWGMLLAAPGDLIS